MWIVDSLFHKPIFFGQNRITKKSIYSKLLRINVQLRWPPDVTWLSSPELARTVESVLCQSTLVTGPRWCLKTATGWKLLKVVLNWNWMLNFTSRDKCHVRTLQALILNWQIYTSHLDNRTCLSNDGNEYSSTEGNFNKDVRDSRVSSFITTCPEKISVNLSKK